MEKQAKEWPGYAQKELEAFLKCGRFEHAFLRVRCDSCHTERLVAFSCKRRGFCPSCGARRMVESATLLVDEVLPRLPMRQWVLSFSFQLRFLFAGRPEAMGRVLGIVYRAIETYLIQQPGCIRAEARTGAVTVIQHFGGALNLNIHFDLLLFDGVYVIGRESLIFSPVSPPGSKVLESLVQMISERVARYLEHQEWLVRDIETSYLQA